MRHDLGLSLSLASGGYAGYQLAQALFSPLLGKCADHYGVKCCIVIGGLSMTIGCGLMAFVVREILLYYLVWIIFISIAVRFAASSACQINIAKWFLKKRGLAMSIFFTSGGMGGFIFTHLLSSVVKTYSWRKVWSILMLCGVLTVFLAVFVLKEHPEDVGQQVDNGDSFSKSENKRNTEKIGNYIPQFIATNKTNDGWTLREVRKEKTYYYLIYFRILVSFYMVAIGNFCFGYLDALMLGENLAATAIGMYSLANIIGRLLSGMLSDYIDSKYIILISSVLMIIGLLFLLFAQNTAMVLAFSWISGIGFGTFLVTPSNALVNYFGSQYYSAILSSFGFVSGIIGSFSSLILGALCDLAGSSIVVWYATLVTIAVAFFLALRISPPQKT